MSGLFERQVRLGGDPGGFSEFARLSEELMKLDHPARPDVDWSKVEQLCLALFDSNGADLQSVTSYALARSHLDGLRGMLEGLMLVEALCLQWQSLWPRSVAMRVDTLSWLFGELQPLLRRYSPGSHAVIQLAQLSDLLGRLHVLLMQHAGIDLSALMALSQQIVNRTLAGPVTGLSTAMLHLPTQANRPLTCAPLSVTQVVLLAPPITIPVSPPWRRPQRRWVGLGCAALMTLSSVFGFWWWDRTTHLHRLEAQARVVRLENLRLFEPRSASFKPESTRLLVDALMGIKAQPGRLIVIAGHTDGTGNEQHNLRLSQERASAVRDWLQSEGGIPQGCFMAQGHGSAQPVAPNDTLEGREQNRRVEIRLIPHDGSCAQAAWVEPRDPVPSAG